MNKQQLIAAFTAAKVAMLANADIEDKGTSNMDRAAIFPGRKRKAIEAAAAEAGVELFDSRWLGQLCLFVRLPGNSGQGYRRTAMAEACTKVLKDAGLEASTYYQID